MPVATALITTAGVNAAATAASNSLTVQITHIALGAGKYTPTSGQTALVDRREVAVVSRGSAQGSQLTVGATFLSSSYAGAQYDVGEIGLYLGDPLAGGILFAVVSSPTFAGARRHGTLPDYTPRATVTLSGVPTGSVTVTVDPMAGAALIALDAHEAASDPHTQYLRKAGGTMTGPLVLAANAAAAMQAVTLQQLQGAFSGSFTAQGSITLPSGHIVRWGSSTTPVTGSGVAEASGTYNFPAPFPTACLWAIAAPYNPGAPIDTDDAGVEVSGWTAAGLSVRTKWSGGGGNNIIRGIVYLAIGH